MAEQYGAKKMGVRADQPVCFLCRKTIWPGMRYHYIKPKGRRMKYLHTFCWEKERTTT